MPETLTEKSWPGSWDVTEERDFYAAEARRDLLFYTQINRKEYIAGRMHQAIAAKYQGVESGKFKRVIVNVAPQHGKSQLTTVEFATWYLGKHPEQQVAVGSYASSLSERASLESRERVRHPTFSRIFPRVRVYEKKATLKEWRTNRGGGFRAVGVGGGLTGWPVNVMIIDDPFADYQEAHSPVTREFVSNWYKSVVLPRMSPTGAIIIIMCMTGDTPVLMADGTERPLCEIRPGDKVATYDRGRLAESAVQNHASQGRDNIYRITMTSGRVVRATERHPFLVEQQGQRRWIRLKNLTTDHRIVTLRDNGGNGKASSARSRGAESPLIAEDTAYLITSRRNGPTGIALRPSTRKLIESVASRIATVSPSSSLTPYCSHRAESAQSARIHQAITFGRIGAESSASITIMRAGPYGAYSATIATSPLAMPSRRQLHSQWSSTSEFTTEAIISIEPAGTDEVFDVQIAGTENFIANGLVSHNTRWHPDDLVGRLLSPDRALEIKERGGDDEGWEVLSLPALARENDPIGRKPGEALFPERYNANYLRNRKAQIGNYLWGALYDQEPRPIGANRLAAENMKVIDAADVPTGLTWVRGWDLATSQEERADFTSGMGLALGPEPGGKGEKNCVYLRNLIKGQWEWSTARERIKEVAMAERVLVGIEAVGGFKTAYSNLREVLPKDIVCREIGVDKDKLTRALPWIALAEAGRVYMVTGDWTVNFRNQLRDFPTGTHDDDIDATSLAYGMAKNIRTVFFA